MAKKASRVRYNGTAPFVDDIQANRVQALGSSSRLTTEDMKELGTLNIVEIVDDVPQVDVSVDQNENGTNDLLSLFANKGYGCQVVAVPSGSAVGSAKVKVRPGSYIINGQRVAFEGTELDLSTASGNQVVYLRPYYTSGNKVSYGSTAPAGTITIATLATVEDGQITQADITDNRPLDLSQVKAIDYELAKVDIFVPVKQSGTGDTIARTMYMERVFLNNISMSYQVNGVATNSFSLETDNKRWFLNGSAQIVVHEYRASASTSSVTMPQTPAQLANGDYMLKVVKNGNDLVEGTDFTVSGTTVSFTTALATGDLVKFRFTSSDGGEFFSPNPAIEDPHPELAGGIKEGQVELYLSDKANERVARVQSASITLPLNREQLDELGSSYPYDRPLQLPVNVNVSLELKDSDLELMARFAGKDIATVKEIALDDLVKDMGLTVKIYRETDVKRAKLPAGHPDKLAIKTLNVINLIPQSENWDVRVDSDATQSFEFLAHNLTIEDKLV